MSHKVKRFLSMIALLLVFVVVTTVTGCRSQQDTNSCVHVWDEGVITTPATEFAAGLKTYTCTLCGAIKTETIPQLSGKTVPEGAIAVTDYKQPYSSVSLGGLATAEMADEHEGMRDVLLIRSNDNKPDVSYLSVGTLPSGEVSRSNVETLGYVFKVFVTDNLKGLSVTNNPTDGASFRVDLDGAARNQWIEVIVPLNACDVFTDDGYKGDIYFVTESETAGPLVYISQIYLTTELPSFNITVIGGTADKTTAVIGQTVTLTVDETMVPADKQFAGWMVNGTLVEDNTFLMPGRDVTAEAFYALPEKDIPEDAIMIENYVHPFTSWNQTNWGTENAVFKQVETYAGRNNLLAVGTEASGGRQFNAFTIGTLDEGIITSENYNDYGYYIRMYMTSKAIVVGVGNNGAFGKVFSMDKLPQQKGGWIEMVVPLAHCDVFTGDTFNPDIFMLLATDAPGFQIYIDQVYLMKMPKYYVSVEGGYASPSYAIYSEEVTLSVNKNKIPEGKEFFCWDIDGKYVYENSFKMENKNVTVKAVYADPSKEAAVPDDAVLMTGFTKHYGHTVLPDSVWGNGNAELKFYDSFEEQYNVVGVYTNADQRSFNAVTLGKLPSGVVTSSNYDSYAYRIRLYIKDQGILVGFSNAGTKQFYDTTGMILEKNKWIEMIVPLSACYVNGNSGINSTLYMLTASDAKDTQLYVDQVQLIELDKHTITVSGGTANKAEAVYGETITLTLDENSIPAGKKFYGWNVNQVTYTENAFTMPDEDVVVEAVFSDESLELPIPEDAILIQDYTSPWNTYVQGIWGTHNAQLYYKESYEGHYNVLGIGTSAADTQSYNALTIGTLPKGVITEQNYTQYSYRIRLYISQWATIIGVGNNGGLAPMMDLVSANLPKEQWIEVTVPLSQCDVFPADGYKDTIFLMTRTDNAGAQIYVDSIYLIKMQSHTITVTGGTADKTSATFGETVTLTLDEGLIPAGMSFKAWSVNGQTITENTFSMPDENVVVEAIYGAAEEPVPEGAILINGYEQPYTPAVNPNWGTSQLAHSQYIAMYEGKANVMAFGATGEMQYVSMSFADGNFNDPSKQVVIRIWVDPSIRLLYLFAADVNQDYLVINPDTGMDIPRGQWYDLTVPMSELIGNQSSPALYLKMSNSTVEGRIYIDKVFLQDAISEPDEPIEPDVPSDELALPDGAVLVEDYSNGYNSEVNMNWGSPELAYKTVLDSYEDRNNVFAVGSINANRNFVSLSIANGTFNDSSKDLVLRMKVDSSVLLLHLFAGDVNVDYKIIDGDSGLNVERDKWIEVSIPMSKIIQNGSSNILYVRYATTKADGSIYIDQIYLADPSSEGSDDTLPDEETLVTDYDTAHMTAVLNSWGSPEVAWYSHMETYEGKNGVMAFGTNSDAINYAGMSLVDGLFNDPNKELVMRVWVDPTVRLLYLFAADVNQDYLVINPDTGLDIPRGQWYDLVIPMDKLLGTNGISPAIYGRLSTQKAEGSIYIDRVYLRAAAQQEPGQNPEGSGVIVQDYATSYVPYVHTLWGTPEYAYFANLETYEGSSNVLALGSTTDARSYVSMSIAEGTFNDPSKTLVVRLRASSNLLLLQFFMSDVNIDVDVINTDNGKNIARNQWIEVSIPMRDLIGNSNSGLLFVKYATEEADGSLYIDKIYIQ